MIHFSQTINLRSPLVCHTAIENLPRGETGLRRDELREFRVKLPSEQAALVAVIAAEKGKSFSAVLRAAISAGIQTIGGSRHV